METNQLITIIFPLYNAVENIPALVEALSKQKHPENDCQKNWLTAIFIDNCSSDKTVETLQKSLEAYKSNISSKIIRNSENIGLARSLNKAIEEVNTEYFLSCHCDCIFGHDEYVYNLFRILDSDSNIAAVAGTPEIKDVSKASFVEKLNVVNNLMDIVPSPKKKTLLNVPFVEGRCDGFNLKAIKEVGLYPTDLKLAGEDQLLCESLREKGYKILQSTIDRFYLYLSFQQNSIYRLLVHTARYARAHVVILLKSRKSFFAPTKLDSSWNKQARFYMRGLQILSSLGYLFFIASLLFSVSLGPAISVLFLIAIPRILLVWKHLKIVEFSPKETLTALALQPLFDLSYNYGVVEGIYSSIFTPEAEVD